MDKAWPMVLRGPRRARGRVVRPPKKPGAPASGVIESSSSTTERYVTGRGLRPRLTRRCRHRAHEDTSTSQGHPARGEGRRRTNEFWRRTIPCWAAGDVADFTDVVSQPTRMGTWDNAEPRQARREEHAGGSSDIEVPTYAPEFTRTFRSWADHEEGPTRSRYSKSTRRAQLKAAVLLVENSSARSSRQEKGRKKSPRVIRADRRSRRARRSSSCSRWPEIPEGRAGGRKGAAPTRDAAAAVSFVVNRRDQRHLHLRRPRPIGKDARGATDRGHPEQPQSSRRGRGAAESASAALRLLTATAATARWTLDTGSRRRGRRSVS